MGAKVQTENYLPRQALTKDLSRESNGGRWPSFYTEGRLPNGQFHYVFLPRTVADSHSGYDKDVLKQTMLEHEAIFKDQVYELHRLYRVQRGLMDQVRRNEPFKHGIPYEASSSSSTLPSQRQLNGAQRWNDSSFPLASPCSGRPLIAGPDTVQPSPNSVKGKSIPTGPSPFHNCYSPKTSEASEATPTKFRKRKLDLQLPADEYIDINAVDQFGSAKDLHISKRKTLADLNEPVHVEETTAFSSFGILGHGGNASDLPYRDLSARLLSSSTDMLQKSKKLSLNGTPKNLHDIRTNGQDWFCYALESEHKISTRSIHQEVHPEKFLVASRPVQILTSEHIKREPWKPNSAAITQCSDSFSMSNYHNLGSHLSSQPGLSWGQSATSWGKANFMTPNPTLVPPSLFQPSVRSNEFFGKWDPNSSRGPNVAFGNETPVRNGISQGSSSIFEERPACFPQAGFDYVNCNYSENTTPFKGNNSKKATSCNNVNPVRDMNLNETITTGVFADKIVDKDCKLEDSLAILPWLRGKGSIEVKTSGSSHKILGVSIFGNPPEQKDPLDHSHRSRYKEVECSKRKLLFDMNLPCDETSDSEVGRTAMDEVVAKKKEANSASCKINIDLNSCITEEMGTGIDLEALISLESEDGILSLEDSLIKESEKEPVGIRPE
ncbi:hypothetical protein KSS87_017683, partial [Heliosperma pusillum]